MNVEIRPETEADRAAVFDLNVEAFPSPAEAKLVNALRDSAEPYISLVATNGRDIVGHVMFTPITLDARSELKLMGLAPMAVSPALQRSGIGTLLVNAGLERCRELGIGAIVVLGHAQYYPRFGFRPASAWGIECEYDVPDEVFMLLELQPGYLKKCKGTIRYHAAFADA